MRREQPLTPSLLLLAGLLAAPVSARAAPELAIDLDPAIAGVQSDVTIAVGEARDVAIVVSGVEATAPLNAYELDLDFDPAVVSATAVANGGFLAAPVQTLEADTADPDVNVAAFTEGAAGSSGDGVLATARLMGDAAGQTTLTLSDVILAASFGVEIADVALNDATIRVPEPTLELSFGVLLLALVVLARIGKGGRRA